MLGRTFALDVAIFSGHPSLPVGQSLLAVALETAPQSQLTWRLDPNRVGQIRPERLPRRRNAFEDDEVARLDDKLPRPIRRPVTRGLAGCERHEHVSDELR